MQTTQTIERIKRQIANNPVLLYLKGTPDFPMCGFSGRVIHILETLKAKYAYVNVLENPDIRAELPIYVSWPTFPQFYIKGELIGGCDILTELQHKGELEPMLANVGAVLDTAAHATPANE
jgi:monothiol glutaredoxin